MPPLVFLHDGSTATLRGTSMYTLVHVNPCMHTQCTLEKLQCCLPVASFTFLGTYFCWCSCPSFIHHSHTHTHTHNTHTHNTYIEGRRRHSQQQPATHETSPARQPPPSRSNTPGTRTAQRRRSGVAAAAATRRPNTVCVVCSLCPKAGTL